MDCEEILKELNSVGFDTPTQQKTAELRLELVKTYTNKAQNCLEAASCKDRRTQEAFLFFTNFSREGGNHARKKFT